MGDENQQPEPKSPETVTVTVQTKPRSTVVLEGALYFVISAFTPVVQYLDSDKVLDTRHAVSLALAAIVAGAISLKAFFSQSTSPR